jgi:hypothetical protein
MVSSGPSAAVVSVLDTHSFGNRYRLQAPPHPEGQCPLALLWCPTQDRGRRIRHIAELVGEGRIPVRQLQQPNDWPGDLHPATRSITCTAPLPPNGRGSPSGNWQQASRIGRRACCSNPTGESSRSAAKTNNLVGLQCCQAAKASAKTRSPGGPFSIARMARPPLV